MSKASKTIAVLFVLLLTVAAAVGLVFWLKQERLPDHLLLEADFQQDLPEYIPENAAAKVLYEDQSTVLDVVEALHRAAGDDRVVGLVARVGASGLGLAKIQELREAVLAFRAAGKPAYAWADTIGEGSGGNGAYYLASAFDKIYLQPSGDVGLTGLLAVSPFLRGTLDKLGVVPRLDHRKQYKTAMNLFTEKSFTDAHREELASVVGSSFDQMVRGIAEGRKLGEDQVRGLIDRGPYYGTEAQKVGLVDEMAYRDQVYDEVRKQVGGDAELLYLSKYLDRAGSPWDEGETVALVYGVGNVVRGESSFSPLTGSATMGSDTVAKAIRDAVDDDDVKAILFRVDSPGGSYVASDTIWRETARAREKGKPVVVSMGDVAGSGGYFVAMAADKIVAQPSTITGSIGVLGGKMLTRDMWNKLGITFDELQKGTNATLYSSLDDYTEAEWQRFQDSLDRVYDDFVGKAAEGRGLPREKVEEIAKGRIWSGEDARKIGLVDELGGFTTALAQVRKAAGIPEGQKVRLELFPHPKSTWDLLFGEEPDNSEQAARVAVAAALKAVRPAARLAAQAGLLGDDPGLLSMPPLEIGP